MSNSPTPPLLAAPPLEEADIIRGILDAYRISKVDYVQNSPDGMAVDCGFEIKIAPPKSSGKVENKRIVQSVKSPDGDYALRISSALKDSIYTYQAM